jgi:hypothetical protein
MDHPDDACTDFSLLARTGPLLVKFLTQARRMIESAFEPLGCECLLSADAAMSVRVFDRETGRVDLFVAGIATEQLRTWDDVHSLIQELHYDLKNISARPAERQEKSSET